MAKGIPLMGRGPDDKAKIINVDENGALMVSIQDDRRDVYQIADDFISSGEIGIAEIAGIKNSMYRGKYLGTSYTPEQRSQVASGKFLDLWVGDYWIINGTQYIIAAFNYYRNSGNLNFTTNHITLVSAGGMYTHRMNPTDTTEGGYVGSEMYTTGLDQAKTKIYADFGGYVLTHSRFLTNAVVDDKASGLVLLDSDVELMSEVMVYGTSVFGTSGYNIGTDKVQLPLFALRPDLISIRISWWLRDVTSSTSLAYVNDYGLADSLNASLAAGVRPVFSIF
jgi:hypothetical protein